MKPPSVAATANIAAAGNSDQLPGVGVPSSKGTSTTATNSSSPPPPTTASPSPQPSISTKTTNSSATTAATTALAPAATTTTIPTTTTTTTSTISLQQREISAPDLANSSPASRLTPATSPTPSVGRPPPAGPKMAAFGATGLARSTPPLSAHCISEDVAGGQPVQQAPLALTTQNNSKSSSPTPAPTITVVSSQASVANLAPQIKPIVSSTAPLTPASAAPVAMVVSTPNSTVASLASANPITLATTASTTTATLASNSAPQSLTLATTVSTTTGPTALVIIPQHSTSAAVTSTIGARNRNNSVTTAVTLATSAQSTPIQLQTTTTAHMSNLTPVTITAHPHSTAAAAALGQPSSMAVTRPPSLPVIPVLTTSTATTPSPAANLKQETNKYVCCLIENGVRCDRIACNASFSARIQKIVSTKKVNISLDPTARHAYICEHHKAVITVAKKAPVTREPKGQNAKNYTTNNNTNILNQQQPQHSTFAQNMQHSINVEMPPGQHRFANNHAVMNNMQVRPGPQITYGHFQGIHPNQVGSVDVLMTNKFDAGGDSGQSSSGGVEVDLQQLQVNTLRRYKRHFRVQTRPGLNKIQLAESLKGHFRTLPIIEKEAITYFVYIVKCYRNKLDLNPKAD